MDTRETTRETPRGRSPADRSLLGRLGSFTVRRRWWVIGAWVVLLAVMASFASGLTDRLGSGGFEVPGSQSLAVQRDLEQRFANQFPTTALVTVHDEARTVDDPAFRAVVEGIATRVEAVPGVGGVESFASTGSPAFVSPDRRTTYLVAGLTGDQNTQLDTVPEVAAAAREGVPAGVEVETGGAAAFYERMNEISRHDLEQAERVSFPITLIVLLLAFTSLVAAGLPIMLALVSLGVTLGVLYFLAGVTDMNVYVTNTASIVGIGVGIDYALFVVTRFREELRRGRSVAEAVPVTLATSGRAVALSGATVIVALAGMFLVDIQAFRSMAIGSMSVVAVAVLAAITLLPAVLSLVGHWVDRLRIPVLRPRAAEGEGFWHRWAVRIMRRPWAFMAAALAVLLLLAVPFAGIRLGQPGAGHPARRREPAAGHRAPGGRVRGRRHRAHGGPGRHPGRGRDQGQPGAGGPAHPGPPGRRGRGQRAEPHLGAAPGRPGRLRPAVRRRPGRGRPRAGPGRGRAGQLGPGRRPGPHHGRDPGGARVRGGRGPGRPDPRPSTSPPPGWPGRPGSAGPPPTTSTWPARSPASSRWSSCPSWPCRSCCWRWPSARWCCRCRRSP